MAKIDGVQEITIDLLRPYSNNAKIHGPEQVEQIAESIKEFGFISPCLIDHDYNIIAGHGRLMAAQKLGMEKIPCVFVEGLTEDQKRAYILVDNKLTELGDWDTDALQIELEDIDLDMSVFGFEELQIEDIDEDNSRDEVPELNREPKAKHGDVYRLGDHRLMCGDATNIDDVERLIDNNTIHLALTDPPYGIDIVSNEGYVGAGNVASVTKYKAVKGDDSTDTAKDNYAIISSLASKQIIWGGNYFIDFLPFSDSWLIWDKRVDMPSNNFADGEMAWCSFHTPIRIYHQLWNGMIREGESGKRVHPTQKPVRMLSDILNDFSDEGDNILDCFGGSGSTLIACEQTGRNCFMMEYEPYYVDVIIERWETLTGQKARLING